MAELLLASAPSRSRYGAHVRALPEYTLLVLDGMCFSGTLLDMSIITFPPSPSWMEPCVSLPSHAHTTPLYIDNVYIANLIELPGQDLDSE
jgi:hypothetical protein